jgi:hypothetical protein
VAILLVLEEGSGSGGLRREARCGLWVTRRGRHGVACGSMEGRNEEEKRRKKSKEMRFF